METKKACNSPLFSKTSQICNGYTLVIKDGKCRIDFTLQEKFNCSLLQDNSLKIRIPTGHTAKIDNNTVIFEPKTENLKKGDFVIGRDGQTMAIFKERNGVCSFCEYFGISLTGDLTYYDGRTFGSIGDYRLMTDSEKQTLLDKLHEAGKDWDKEKCEIVDWVWKPKIGEKYQVVGSTGVSESIWTDGVLDEVRWSNGSVFRTEKLAESALELLKQAKHY